MRLPRRREIPDRCVVAETFEELRSTIASVPPACKAFSQGIKDRIRCTQIGAALAANRELILLYWDIGREILARQRQEGWGAKFVDQLAAGLRRAFPELKGFSARNLKYIRAFAEAWPDKAFMQQAVAQIPWGHRSRLRVRRQDELLAVGSRRSAPTTRPRRSDDRPSPLQEQESDQRRVRSARYGQTDRRCGVAAHPIFARRSLSQPAIGR